MSSFSWPRVPLRQSLSGYSWESLRVDGLAGLTVALLAVPQCMAYALLAELNPIYGLYAALVGAIVGGVFASSELMVTGPTAKVSLVVGSIVVAYPELDPFRTVVTLAVMVGGFQVLFSLLGVGNLAAFVSHSVVRGFIVGGGIVIIGDQVLYLFHAASDKSPYFVVRVYEALLELGQSWEVPTARLGLGAGAIVLILSLRWLHDALPAGILTILAGGVLSAWWGLDERGIELVGSIPQGLPDLTIPALSVQHASGLFAGALALTILGSVQSISIGRSLAHRTDRDIDENQELFGQGMANLLTGFLQGYPVSASFTRSFLNHDAGARTRISTLIGGLLIVLIVLLAAPYAYYLPIPVLAGLIIVVVADIFDWPEIKTILSITTVDRVAFAVTGLSVLVLQLDTAIYLGVAVTLLMYLRESSKLDLKEYRINEDGQLQHITDPSERLDERIALIDVNGEVFFGAAERIRTRVRQLLRESEDLRVVILRLKNALNVDSTSVRMLETIAEEMRRRDKTLMLSGVTPKIRTVLEDSGVAQVIDHDKILIAQKELLRSTHQAVARATDHIETVLEGEVARDEEQPVLKDTLQQLLEEESDSRQKPFEHREHV